MYFDETIKDASKYSAKVVKVLTDQKEKYEYLKNLDIENNLQEYVYNNKLVLSEGTLVHGTAFDKEKLLSIKDEGILANEFGRNKPERYAETYYMADFFKVRESSMTVIELLNCANKNNQVIEYLPKTEGQTSSPKVAFIVNTDNLDVKKYIERDLFANNNTELLEFITSEFYESLERRKRIPSYNLKLGQASLPIGLPYSAICGIIVDHIMETERKDELDFIKQTFGNELVIVSSNGNILSYPKELDMSR